MKKTSIYLEPELDEALARRAAEEGLTKAEYIRRTLSGAMDRPKRPKAKGGIYRSPDGRGGADVEDMLEEYGFGED